MTSTLPSPHPAGLTTWPDADAPADDDSGPRPGTLAAARPGTADATAEDTEGRQDAEDVEDAEDAAPPTTEPVRADAIEIADVVEALEAGEVVDDGEAIDVGDADETDGTTDTDGAAATEATMAAEPDAAPATEPAAEPTPAPTPVPVTIVGYLRSTTEVDRIVSRLEELASEHEHIQEQLALLRDERDRLILRGLAQGMSSTELAIKAHLTGARVRAIADAASSSSARERVASAVARLVAHTPATCTTYGALADAVGIGSAKGVASSLASNPDVSGRAGARVLLLRWASPTLGGYVIPSKEPAWQTQGDDTATRLECLQAEDLVSEVPTPDGPAWVVPFERVCADHVRLAEIVCR